MRRMVLLAFALLGLTAATAAPVQRQIHPVHLRPIAVVVLPQRMTPRFAALSNRLTPRGAAWVAAESQRLRGGAIDPAAVRGDAGQICGAAFSSCAGDADIDALCFIVLMQASSDMEQDLKDIMNDVKKMTNSKAAQRQSIRAMHQVTVDELNRERDALKDNIDSMSEMSEMDALRLQMAMDRLSKVMIALSVIEKKISDTQTAITENSK